VHWGSEQGAVRNQGLHVLVPPPLILNLILAKPTVTCEFAELCNKCNKFTLFRQEAIQGMCVVVLSLINFHDTVSTAGVK